MFWTDQLSQVNSTDVNMCALKVAFVQLSAVENSLQGLHETLVFLFIKEGTQGWNES